MDAYNANPTSMSAAIKSFSANQGGNNYLILGDMLELGEYSQLEHRRILELLKEKGFSNVMLVGSEFSRIGTDFNFQVFKNVEELSKYLEKKSIKNGNVLIKGSRGIQLEKVLEFLN